MSAIVDYAYYTETYKGTDADEASFPALCAQAERVIAAMTHWQVDEDSFESLPAIFQTRYRQAICSQVDFLALNGLESLQDRGGGSGFTVGKVSVQGKAGVTAGGGGLRESVSPMSIAYLEQTGLMNPQIPTLGDLGSLRG